MSVDDNDDMMIINRSGLTIRIDLSGVGVKGRATQGVSLIKLKGGDAIAAVTTEEEEALPIDGEELPEIDAALLEENEEETDINDGEDEDGEEENIAD